MNTHRNLWVCAAALLVAGGIAYFFLSGDPTEKPSPAEHQTPILAENPSASNAPAPPPEDNTEVSSAAGGAVEVIARPDSTSVLGDQTSELAFSGVVIDEDDQPVEGAQVRVEHRHTYRFITGVKVEPAITDAEGRFRTQGVEGGRYSLRATKESFAPSHLYAVSSATEELVIVLHRGATVEGAVTDPRGAPLEGFTVELHGPSFETTAKTATSDAEGHWKITGVEQQTWTLSGRKVNHRTNKVNLQIRWTDHLFIGLVQEEGVNLSGQVVDSINGEGLAELKMQLVTFDPPDVRTPPQEHFRKEAVSGPEGEFTFTRVPPGRFRIYFVDAPGDHLTPGHRGGFAVTVAEEDFEDFKIRLKRSSTVRGRVLLPSGEGAAGASLALAHPQHGYARRKKPKTDAEGYFELSGLHHAVSLRIVALLSGYGRGCSETFTLEQGESIEGIVIHLSVPGRISGTVRDADGQPVTKVYRVQCCFPQIPGRSSDAANTGSLMTQEGHFEFGDLPAGRVLVELSAEGLSPFGDGNCWRVIQKRWVDVVSGKEVSDVDFTILSDAERKERTQRPQTSHISGRLLNCRGEGLEGLPVSVHCLSRGQQRGVAGTALSLRDGSFWIGNLAAGTFRLHVDAPGWIPKTLGRIPSPSSDLEITLSRYAALAGRVIIQETEEPARGFILRHGKPGGKLEEVTVQDAQGRFGLENLSPGAYRLRVEAQGIGVDQQRVELEDGASVTNLLLALRPRCQLDGSVVRKIDGSPLEGATIIPSPGEQTTSAPDGSFTAQGIYPGTVNITVTHPDFGTAQFPDIEAPEPEGAEVTVLELDEPGRIEGRVYGPSGKPWEGITLECGSQKTTADYRGAFEFPILAPGNTTVELPLWGDILTGAGTWKQAVTVSAGQTTEVNFGGGGTTVRGTILENGEPKSLAVVTFRSATTERWLQTDRGGEYEVYGLPRGSYKVTVRHPNEAYLLVEKPLRLTGWGELRLDLSYP